MSVKSVVFRGITYKIRADWKNPESEIEFFSLIGREWSPFLSKVNEYEGPHEVMGDYLAVFGPISMEDRKERSKRSGEIQKAVENMVDEG